MPNVPPDFQMNIGTGFFLFVSFFLFFLEGDAGMLVQPLPTPASFRFFFVFFFLFVSFFIFFLAGDAGLLLLTPDSVRFLFFGGDAELPRASASK